MTTKLRFRYAWILLAGGNLFMSLLPGRSWLYQVLSAYYASDWTRFLVYAAAASIPCAAWRTKRRMLYSLLVVILSIVSEVLRALVLGPSVHPELIPADLFGIAAGVLLGLNLRHMSASAGSDAALTESQRRSTIV